MPFSETPIMSDHSTQETTAVVLRWINEVRAQEGWPPIQVLPARDRTVAPSQGCPVARGLGWGTGVTLHVTGSDIYRAWYPQGNLYRVPSDVGRFISDVTVGLYPGLDTP